MVEFPSSTVTVLESAGTANFQLRVAGRVPAGGMVVPFTITGTATGGGVDYTLPGTFTVPAGDYVVGSLVNVPVSLVNDSLPEGNETVIVTINPTVAGSSYRLGSTTSCGGTAIGSATLTITDDDVSVTLNKALVPTTSSGVFNLSITGGTPIPAGGTNPASNQGNGGSTGAVKVAPLSVITLTETAGTSTLLSNYTTALSCVDGSGTSVPVTGSGTSRTINTPDLTASAAARAITCTYTNTAALATITLNKALAGDRLAVSDQFSVAIRTGGVSGPVVSNAANATTAGSYAVVNAGTGTTGSYTAAPGATYTLTEALQSNANLLANYNATISCTDSAGVQTGLPSGVAFNPTAGYAITPAPGAALSCTITNTPIWVQPATRPVIGCLSDGAIFNTAYGGAAAKTSGLDNVWERGATFGASQPANWTLANVATTNPGWSAYNAFPAARFIAHQANTDHNVLGEVDLWYRYVFTMNPNVVLSSFRLAMDFYADNSVSEIRVNDVLQSVSGVPDGNPYNALHYNLNNQLSANLASNWQAGTNTILVKVSSGPNAIGFMARNTVSALCQPTISFTKALSAARIADTDQFTVAIKTGGVGGAVVNSTTNSTTAGTGSTVNAGSGTTGIFVGAASTPYTLTEAASGSASLAQYAGTISCTDARGLQAGLPSGAAYSPTTGLAITPVANAAISCTLSNALPSPTLQLAKAWGAGSLAADNASIGATTGGTNNTAAFGPLAGGTAGNSGAAVSISAGNTISLPAETGTNISNYTTTVACTNAANAPSNAANGQLAGTLAIVAADAGKAVVCTYTNTRKFLAISGRVFLDTGAGGGTANDGILNGGEVGQAGITVKLTNCASATAISTTTTDGGGNYSLSVPASTAAGANLCVQETNSGSRVSTGASVGAVALPSGTATVAAGGTYTYTRTTTPDTIAFAFNGTGHAGLSFGDVGNSTFTASGAKTGLPGNTVTYAHTFTAGTGGSVSFSIASTTPTPALTGWSEKIFADPGCSGSLQTGAATLYPPAVARTLTAGQVLCVVMQEFIPATAQQGNSNSAKLQASFTYTNAGPALSASYTLDDVTTVSSAALELKKEVRNVTQAGAFGVNNQAKSGEILEYRVTYTNNGVGPISNLAVNDTTPAYTSFASASAGTTPATLTACTKNTPANPLPAPAVSCALAQPMGGTGDVGWKFTGTLNPSMSGEVLFQVKVD